MSGWFTAAAADAGAAPVVDATWADAFAAQSVKAVKKATAPKIGKRFIVGLWPFMRLGDAVANRVHGDLRAS